MKPFYILLLIVGIVLTLYGADHTIDHVRDWISWSDVYSDTGRQIVKEKQIQVIFGSIVVIIGLLISLFSYGKLKTINRTD